MTMTHTQTMVQLTDELINELDREAKRTGESRSSVIRNAISAYLDERTHVVGVRRYFEGYHANPPSTPDEWGDFELQAGTHGREVSVRLDAEDRKAGLQW